VLPREFCLHCNACSRAKQVKVAYPGYQKLEMAIIITCATLLSTIRTTGTCDIPLEPRSPIFFYSDYCSHLSDGTASIVT